MSVRALLNHLPKINGLNALLEDWKERMEGVARLCNVAPYLKAELTLSTPARLQPARWRKSLEQILSLLGDVYDDLLS